MKEKIGFAGKLAHAFIDSKLTPLIIVASILLGIGAVLMLPREEEPQIIVPMIDLFVQMPGASAKEVEQRVTRPMEKLLWEIPGVEYIYSTSAPGYAMAIVRFYVGEDEEKSIVRLNQKMFANFDLIPSGASQPLIKPRSIDDVPILALTLSSDHYDHFMLRRIAAQVHDQIKEVGNVSEVKIIGGQTATGPGHSRQRKDGSLPYRSGCCHSDPGTGKPSVALRQFFERQPGVSG